jgi:predicted lipase
MGYVGFYDRTIVVVYRGTTNFKNLLVDLDFGKSQPWGDQPGEVHSGFLKSHRNLWSGVLQNIIKAKSRCPKCNRVLFTGHSLGAAITTLASVELARNPIGLSIQALTLGSPRVGNQKFVDYASRMVPNAIRWVHTTDPVAHVPPRSVFKYAHRAREVWQSAASTYRLCSQTNGEDSSCSDSVPFYDLHDLDTHSVYGGVDLHSGGCATFAKRSETDALTLNKLIEMANTDSFQQATQD